MEDTKTGEVSASEDHRYRVKDVVLIFDEKKDYTQNGKKEKYYRVASLGETYLKNLPPEAVLPEPKPEKKEEENKEMEVFRLPDNEPLNLDVEKAVELALKLNIDLKMLREDRRAADLVKKRQRTDYFPTLNATYQYLHNYEESGNSLLGVTSPKNDWTLMGKMSQTVFNGFERKNRYEIAGIEVDMAGISERLGKQDIIFETKRRYFNILKAGKLLEVSRESVARLEAHYKVSRDLFKVGLIPLNDLLRSEVQLANSRLEQVTAENDYELKKSDLNVLLTRSVNAPLNLKDVLDYEKFTLSVQTCLKSARENRLELTLADMDVNRVLKEVELAKGNYYPTVNVEGTVYQRGDDWRVSGGEGVSDPNRWDVLAVASWDFWEWGKTAYSVREKRRRLIQARYRREQIKDRIELEVKQAYLNTRETETNIRTARKAIEQARENFRITRDRYKERVATSTDVLDAQTLLSETMTNFYTALYNYSISKASLYRAMGQVEFP
jgi:outer membrane protein TolC